MTSEEEADGLAEPYVPETALSRAKLQSSVTDAALSLAEIDPVMVHCYHCGENTPQAEKGKATHCIGCGRVLD